MVNFQWREEVRISKNPREESSVKSKVERSFSFKLEVSEIEIPSTSAYII